MHKFKLKKDGKVVGYETHEYDKFTGTINIFHGKMAGVDNGYNIAFVENAYITHQTKHPFVCCDKNRDEVYADDTVLYVSYKAIIKQNDGDFGYHLEFVHLPLNEPIKTGRKVTNILYRRMFKDIELIKE